MSSSKTAIIIPLVIIALVAISVGSWFLFDNYSKDNIANITTTSPSSSSQNNTANLSTNQKGNTNMIKTLADFDTPATESAATLHTTKGDIHLTLYPDQTPLTVTNFVTLARDGYYDGVSFHRVIEDFMAQTGDPNSKDPAMTQLVGTGGPGYTIEDEFVDTLVHDRAGVLSMANTGQPASGGSQFFLTFVPTPWLDGKHTIFGEVADEDSLAVLMSITQGDIINNISFP